MNKSRFVLFGLILLAIGSTAVQSPVEADNRTQLLTLELQLEELKNDYGKDHPKVRAVGKQIELLRRYVDADSGPVVHAAAQTGPELSPVSQSTGESQRPAQPLPDMSDGPGRYTLSSNTTEIVLLDTHTGRSWLLSTRGRSSDSPAWIPIQR